ncbi:Eco57I restriction-modification methylase domain-containing protein [Rhizobium sp. Rhizsp82]|uniref:Eco57I restriction-modification methylase domain-containing protein n=1 Tax=Rhizobium sp. Rhizsp82 TaxID=3243057 RepID=UPI0039B42BC7
MRKSHATNGKPQKNVFLKAPPRRNISATIRLDPMPGSRMTGRNTRQKLSGAYFTPPQVAASLVKWAVHKDDDRLLDPSCGDGEFISRHRNSVGIEQDAESARLAINRAPWALVHEGDFFAWASETQERFDCVAGNPPFIRYQTFTGDVRSRAANLCSKLGVELSGLASSWAPFVIAAASVLQQGGRMAFVVPAEIGHATYAKPLLRFLTDSFALVQVVAIRKKLFPQLSEDCWLLYADEYGSSTNEIALSVVEQFDAGEVPPPVTRMVSVQELHSRWSGRLRPYLLSDDARDLYLDLKSLSDTVSLGDIASVGIGYVTGANDYFHLRPSEAAKASIPSQFLQTTVRNGRSLPSGTVSDEDVRRWFESDEPFLLLRLPKTSDLPAAVKSYLETSEAKQASSAYKCRSRDPWYSVPDVNIPDFFLTYMSGVTPNLVRNDAQCSCTNSVHAVRFKSKNAVRFMDRWNSDAVQLSAELEGHPLGGGMLKLEPREAARLILPNKSNAQCAVLEAATLELRSWRHHA